MRLKSTSFRIVILTILVLLNIVSRAQLVPQFTATPLSGCAPLLVNFQDQTTGGAAQWKWDLGNGTIAFIQNPSVTYFNPGTYTIKLVVKNASGSLTDSITKLQYITVYALPTVNFTGTPVAGCFPLHIGFTDNSTPGSGTLTSRLWDFGDGILSTLQNPIHTYSNIGNYNVTLVVTNSNGCTKTLTKPNYITVTTGVTPAFTHSNPSGCTVPENVTFQNQSTGPGTLSFQWSFGDGAFSTLPSPTHTYTAIGNYTVQLIVTSSLGCTDTITQVNAVSIGTVNADYTFPDPWCTGEPNTLTNTSIPTPVSVFWTLGDGTTSTAFNPVKTYATPGNYTVVLISNFGGCQDTVSKTITVSSKPTQSFTASPLTSCSAPLTVNFTNTTTGSLTSEWSFGDGTTSTLFSPTHTYTTPGFYTVTLISANFQGCRDTLMKTDYIKIVPPVISINFLPKQGCSPFSWTFNSSVTGADPVVSYLWNFGDGTTSTAPIPTHVFATGLYDIQLIITTAGGCSDTAIAIGGIRASTKPVPNFSANPRDVCAETPINFTDLSTGTVTSWLWYFGDGGTSTEQNPSHTYTDTGFFSVTLFVSNFGCQDSIRFINYIHIKPPIANFIVPLNCINHYTKTFTDQSIGADQWAWNFGDGNTSTLQNPVHTYSAVGTYLVTLTVFNISTGCSYTTTKNIIVADEHAVFTASITELCKNSATVFTATSIQGAPSAIVNFSWDFGDGSIGSGITVSHTYSTVGSYNVRLIITDINSCKDTLVKINYIKVYGPVTDFSPSVPGTCLATSVTFMDQTVTDGTHSVVQWHWYFGDGTDQIYTAPPFQHTYTTGGIYTVSLFVTDSFGCTDSISKPNILIISTPIANFVSADTVSCPGKPIVFTNASSGPGLSYSWNFGDGNTSIQANPTHIYAADGLYTVQLTITDTYGCVDNISKPQYIKIASPLAIFTVSDTLSTCPPLEAVFTNTSLNAASVLWNFGDGNTSLILNPSHIYNIPGVYLAKLTVTSPGGCTSVKTQQIIIRGPTGSFTYTPISGCTPVTVHFTGTTQAGITFLWDFNDGNTFATTDSLPTHVYTLPGVYVPKMILKDAAGCLVPITGPDTIKVNFVTASFTSGTLSLCDTGSVFFMNTSQSNDVITGYLWNFGDGTTSTNLSPVHFYGTTGLYNPTLTVTTQSGCVNQAISLVPIRVVTTPDISFTQSPNGCVPLIMSFTGNIINPDTSAITWLWKFSDGRQFPGQNLVSIPFPNAGNFIDTLIAVNSSGCRDSSFNTLEVYPKPAVTASSNISICQGTGQTISAQGALTYVWSPPTGLSCTNCQTALASPIVSTDYMVTGTSQQGCTNNAQVRVDVTMPFRLQPGRNDTLCFGQSKILTASGAFSYVWSPAAGLNTTSGPTVTASPITTTTYTVIGSDEKDCFKDTTSFLIKVYPVPTISAGNDTTINVGQNVTLTPVFSPGVTNVIWSPRTGIVSSNYPSITVHPTMDMEYIVKCTNPGGCSATDRVNIFVLCNGTNVFIPNTFSPNGDGANDVFYVRGTGLFKIKQARIFNRWGEEIFSKYSVNANDISAGWDGTYKGQKQPLDVYVYMIEIECDNNTTLLYKGNIALIK